MCPINLRHISNLSYDIVGDYHLIFREVLSSGYYLPLRLLPAERVFPNSTMRGNTYTRTENCTMTIVFVGFCEFFA